MSLQTFIGSLSPAIYLPLVGGRPFLPSAGSVTPTAIGNPVVGAAGGPKVVGAGGGFVGVRGAHLSWLDFGTNGLGSVFNGNTAASVLMALRRVAGNDAGSTGNNNVLWKTISGTSSGLNLNFPDAEKLRIGGRSVPADSFSSVTGASVLPLNEWVLVHAEWAFTAKTMRIWLDGVLDAELTGVSFGSNTATVGSVTRNDFVGTSSGAAATTSSCDLAHVAFFSRVLTSTERTDLLAAWNDRPVVSGVVTDDTGAPVARTVRAYDRATGALVDETVSNATTGAYSLTCWNDSEVDRVVLDDAGGTLYNDLIDRVIPG